MDPRVLPGGSGKGRKAVPSRTRPRRAGDRGSGRPVFRAPCRAQPASPAGGTGPGRVQTPLPGGRAPGACVARACRSGQRVAGRRLRPVEARAGLVGRRNGNRTAVRLRENDFPGTRGVGRRVRLLLPRPDRMETGLRPARGDPRAAERRDRDAPALPRPRPALSRSSVRGGRPLVPPRRRARRTRRAVMRKHARVAGGGAQGRRDRERLAPAVPAGNSGRAGRGRYRWRSEAQKEAKRDMPSSMVSIEQA